MMHAPPALVAAHHGFLRTPIRHVVVIVQENRSFDDLFNGYPGADTVTVDPYTGTQLQPRPLADGCNPDHGHAAFVEQYNYGAMNGFQVSPCTAYSYVPASDTKLYRRIASYDGVMADETFQSNQGESFAAHQYLYAGRSCAYPNDVYCMASAPNGPSYCGAGPSVSVALMDMTSAFPGNDSYSGPPCKTYSNTILDEITAAGLTWRYYTYLVQWPWSGPVSDAGCWAKKACRNNVVTPADPVLDDIAKHQLADVSFVTPDLGYSDHPGTGHDGPFWVTAVVEALGEDPYYWQNTTILILWDDWGGWYDHVVPPSPPYSKDPYEYGFRVPLIVVSPYIAPGTVDHSTRNVYGSILRYLETTFSLASLNQVDAQGLTDDLTGLFRFDRNPHPFVPPTKHRIKLSRPN